MESPIRDKRFPPKLAIYRELGRTDEERAWLRGLPQLVDEICRLWNLQLEDPFLPGQTAWTAPGVRGDGTEVVLKVGWPHDEARDEAAALRFWDGDGAVLLYADQGFTLLLERCRPGTTLVDTPLRPEDAITAAGDVLRRLWRHPPPQAKFERLGDVTTRWASLAAERMGTFRPSFDTGVVSLGIELLRSLPNSSSLEVVLHGDFNPGNVLAATRQKWLAIDPKPMVGDPAYDPDPLISQVDEANFLKEAKQRYALMADLVGESTERLIAWGVARRVESALWSLSRGSHSAAEEEMNDAVALARHL